MQDYQQYQFQKLLECIEKTCEQFEISGDHAQKLISMEQVDSLEELIKTYNNVLKILVIYNYGKKKVPQNWYVVGSWNVNSRIYVENLRQFINECVLCWFKRQENYTLEKCKKCIINLRECNNTNNIQTQLLSTAGYKYSDDIDFSFIPRRVHYYKCQNDIKIKSKDSEGFDDIKQKFKASLIQMMADGYIFDVIDDAVIENNSIDRESLWTQWKTEIEKIRRNKKNEKRDLIIKTIILGIVSILVVIGVMVLLRPLISLLMIPIICFLIGLLLFSI